MKKTIIKSAISGALVAGVALCSVSFGATKAPTLNTNTKVITAGKIFSLKVNDAKKMVKWKTSNSHIVNLVELVGGNCQRAKFKALKGGNATITAKIGGKNLKCSVRVKPKTTSKATIVYITESGTKYHREFCRTIKNTKTAVTLTWAKNNGYTACKVCHPKS